MRLVTDKPGERPVIWEWMNRHTQLPWSTDLRVIGQMRDDGSLAAAVAFNAWSPKACWMHVVFDSAHSCTRKLLRAAFEFPFVEVGVPAVYGLTPKDLDEAVNFNKKIGMKPIAETIDCVMFEMRREHCRWIRQEKNDGWKKQTAEAA